MALLLGRARVVGAVAVGALAVVAAGALAGCADPSGPHHGPLPDFAPAPPRDLAGVEPSPDLSTPDLSTPDLSTGDLAEADLAAPDFAAPDLVPPAPACDLGAGPASRLYFAGVASGNTLYLARFDAASGWSPMTITQPKPAVDVALAIVHGQPLLVTRRNDDSVDASWFDPCADAYAAPSQIYALALTLNRPAVAGGAAADVVFRGSFSGDARLYHAHAEWQQAFSAPTTQGNFLSTLNPAAVRFGGGLHALFTGTDDKVYDGTVLDTAGGGTAAQISTAASALAPAATVGADGTLYVVWINTDTNVYWSQRPSGGAFSTAAPLYASGSGNVATSGYPPAIALGADGKPVVVWVGTDHKLYSATLSGSWGAPQAASGACAGAPNHNDCQTTQPPTLAPGLGGDEAELVWVRDSDGQAAHARLVGSTWQAATLVTGSTNFVLSPALATQP